MEFGGNSSVRLVVQEDDDEFRDGRNKWKYYFKEMCKPINLVVILSCVTLIVVATVVISINSHRDYGKEIQEVENDVKFSFTIKDPRTILECPKCPDWMRGFVYIFYETSAYSENVISMGFETELRNSIALSTSSNTVEIRTKFFLKPPHFVELFISSGRPKVDVSFKIEAQSIKRNHTNFKYHCENHGAIEISGLAKNYCETMKHMQPVNEKEIHVFSYLFGIEEFTRNDGTLKSGDKVESIQGEFVVAGRITAGQKLEDVESRIAAFEFHRKYVCACGEPERNVDKQTGVIKFVMDPKCINRIRIPEMKYIFQNYNLCLTLQAAVNTS